MISCLIQQNSGEKIIHDIEIKMGMIIYIIMIEFKGQVIVKLHIVSDKNDPIFIYITLGELLITMNYYYYYFIIFMNHLIIIKYSSLVVVVFNIKQIFNILYIINIPHQYSIVNCSLNIM